MRKRLTRMHVHLLDTVRVMVEATILADANPPAPGWHALCTPEDLFISRTLQMDVQMGPQLPRTKGVTLWRVYLISEMMKLNPADMPFASPGLIQTRSGLADPVADL
jgi:hypothetical protein